MASYEGLVIGIPEEGKAEVALRPQSLHGASALTPVCGSEHERLDDFTVFEGANPVGAEVGDTVLLVGPGDSHAHHFMLFMGLIAIGGLIGFLIFRLVDNQWAFSAYAGALVWLLALIPGVAAAVFFLHRSGRGGGFIIDRVLRKASPDGSVPEGKAR